MATLARLALRVSEASTSFLKKRSKKLLNIGARVATGTRPNNQKFFGSFFQKRTNLPIAGR
jgi:hypothetical protein